jgi:hypothetical protein
MRRIPELTCEIGDPTVTGDDHGFSLSRVLLASCTRPRFA